MFKILLLSLTFTFSLFADAVYSKTYDMPANKVYAALKTSLSTKHLMVVSEIDILAKFKEAGLEKKFGKSFNTNHLTAVKAIIACNGGFGNAIANSDPKMMAFCPIRITVVEKDGKTSVLYVRPTVANKESKAYVTLEKLEAKVIQAIDAIEALK